VRVEELIALRRRQRERGFEQLTQRSWLHVGFFRTRSMPATTPGGAGLRPG
jgi:hypothetical protein